VASCYWSLFKYARYFAKRHPKVIEDEKAVEVIVRLEENAIAVGNGLGRSLTVRTVGTKQSHAEHEHEYEHENEKVDPLEHAQAEGIATVDYANVPKITMTKSNIESRPSTIYSDPFGDSRRQSLS
jgi:hypothetical protein